MKLPKTSVKFARNISHRLISEFSHCFCTNYSIAFARISNCFCPNFGPKQWKFWQKQWENLGNSNKKTRKATAYISGKNYSFCPNFPLLLPECPIAFAWISHCFFPNFSFSDFFFIYFFFFFFGGGGGHSAPLSPPPPPPTPMDTALVCTLFLFSGLFIIHH